MGGGWHPRLFYLGFPWAKPERQGAQSHRCHRNCAWPQAEVITTAQLAIGELLRREQGGSGALGEVLVYGLI